MAGMAPPGFGGQQGQNLAAALASQAGPKNPKTPDDRTDPREETLLDQQRIRRAFEVAMHHFNDTNPMKQIYGVMHAAITRLRDGTSMEDVVDAMATALMTMVTPQTRARLTAPPVPPPQAQGGGVPGPGVPPGMAGPQPPGITAGAPGIGPGMPVSPGPQPG